MALLAIRRTLERGFRSGFASGLGIATADGLYAAVAAFGLTAVSGLVLGQARWVELVGGALILLLGVRSTLAPVAQAAAEAPPTRGLITAYASCLGLTLSNPPTILSFLGLFAGFGVVRSSRPEAAALVAGVFLGSAAWWAVLTAGTSRARARLHSAWRARLTRGAGLAMALLGLGLAARALA